MSERQKGNHPEGRDNTAAGLVAPQEQSLIQLQKAVHVLQRELEAARSENEGLKSSTSWRVTAPLRAIKAALKRSRGSVDSLQARSSLVLAEVPPEIRRYHAAPPEESNELVSLVDASYAMRPLLDVANARRPGSEAPRIAFVGSDQLAHELQFDSLVSRITERNWRDDLQQGEVDYLLVETVWDAGESGWSTALVREGRGTDEVRGLLEYCARLKIPTVVWFREVVANYEQFAWLGAFANVLYAVDDDLLARLKVDYADRPCALLPGFIQPALHNPVRSQALLRAVGEGPSRAIYDGWWDVSTRRVDWSVLTGIAPNVQICESQWEFGGVRVRDHEPSASRTIGCVDELAKSALLKVSSLELFIDGGLRTDWQRNQAMMRAAAGGAAVVDSNASGSIKPGSGFGRSGECAATFASAVQGSELMRSTLVHRRRRELLSGHCLADRLDQISLDLGIGRGRLAPAPSIAMVLVTMRPQLLSGCIERFRADLYQNRELVIVLHGDHDLAAARALVLPEERISMVSMPSHHSLGECLNAGIALSESDYWTKVDDDDLYGPNYLTDIMLARRYMDFDVAGKPPMFAYLESTDELFWDPVWAGHAHLWHAAAESTAALVAGGTITARRDVSESIPFSSLRRGGSDSDFIRRCYDAGIGVLALDGFNFARYRSRQEGFHTWSMNEGEVRNRAIALGNRSAVATAVNI